MARSAEALQKSKDIGYGLASHLGRNALRVIDGGLSVIPNGTVSKENRTEESDEGYFPKDSSVLREVHSTHAVGMLYGQRALLIGATDPRNYIGTSEHTRGRKAPFARLARTAKAFESIFFGSCQEADIKLARIRKIHEDYVHGYLTEDAGPYKAGTPYSAMDPEMMLWTIASMADSAQTLYESLVRSMSEAERESFWQDYRLLGELFGLSKQHTPKTYPEFREYFDNRLESDELHLTESARFAGRQVCFNVPLNTAMQPAKELQNLILLGSIPKSIRELYGLNWTPVHEAAYKAACINSKLIHRTVPSMFQHRGSNSAAFNLIVDEERKRRKNGTAVSMPENAYRLT